MKNYLYTIPNTGDPHKAIALDDKPAIGELIVPNPVDKHKRYLEIKQIIHSNAGYSATLLICMPYDFKKLHQSYNL